MEERCMISKEAVCTPVLKINSITVKPRNSAIQKAKAKFTLVYH